MIGGTTCEREPDRLKLIYKDHAKLVLSTDQGTRPNLIRLIDQRFRINLWVGLDLSISEPELIYGQIKIEQDYLIDQRTRIDLRTDSRPNRITNRIRLIDPNQN